MDTMKEYENMMIKQNNSLENVLEKLKLKGNYSIQVQYGEGVGCDDLDVPVNERKIILTMAPVGYLGSVRAMWIGNLDDMRIFDFDSKPKKISNPPNRSEYEKSGYYAWGAEPEIDRFADKFTTASVVEIGEGLVYPDPNPPKTPPFKI